jgi:phosphatidylglycerol---prolipoprotein diacylglyceryl transferase
MAAPAEIPSMNVFQPFYLVSALAAITLALCFPLTRHMREKSQRRDYWILQTITIIGAIVGAKLSVLIGDLHWPSRAISDWSAILTSGRSITGALILGFISAEIAKPLLNYTMPPNDRFAAILPFSIAIGRIGCALTGCCPGTPHDGFLSITYSDGIPRFPTQIYEMLFHLADGIAFMFMVRDKILFGRLFAIYLVLYGVFRFFTENIRATPKDWNGLSGYQWLSIAMIALGGAFFFKRTFFQPASWQQHSFGGAKS